MATGATGKAGSGGNGAVLVGLEIEWPVDSEFDGSLGPYVTVGAEIVEFVHRPSLSGILKLDEDAGTFPLDIDEGIDNRAVVVLLHLLVVEYSDSRIPGR